MIDEVVRLEEGTRPVMRGYAYGAGVDDGMHGTWFDVGGYTRTCGTGKTELAWTV